MLTWNFHFFLAASCFILAFASPEDPHVARCQTEWERKSCPWFEGWYIRIVDPSSGSSFGVILGSLNSTGEAMVTLMSCHVAEGVGKVEGERGVEGEGERTYKSCGRMEVTEAIARSAEVVTAGSPVTADPDPRSPPNFDWSLAGHGVLRVREGRTYVDMRVGEVRLQAVLTDQLHWKEGDLFASPEGPLAQLVSELLPTRWYVHSVGSRATYTFKNKSAEISGQGWGHEEKNWGKKFPDGHVWAQAISHDNTIQVVFATGYINFFGFPSPLITVIGYRSTLLQQDFRNVDPFTLITELNVQPCEGLLSVVAHTLHHTIKLKISGQPETFGPKLLAPTRETKWEYLCRESFDAKAYIEIWERSSTWVEWFLSKFWFKALKQPKLLEKVKIGQAALEFGEGFLCNKDNVYIKKDKKNSKMDDGEARASV